MLYVQRGVHVHNPSYQQLSRIIRGDVTRFFGQFCKVAKLSLVIELWLD